MVHLYSVLNLFQTHDLIISKRKIEIPKQHIEFQEAKIEQGKIKLQPHISKKILEIPNKLEELKQLIAFVE